LLASGAVAGAEQDGAAAANLAATALDAGEDQERAAVAIVQRWAQKSPRAAATWVEHFPDTPARDASAQNLVALWTVQDSKAAAAWLRGLPEGSLRESGSTAYAQASANRIPAKPEFE
jgi:hypothetical protein